MGGGSLVQLRPKFALCESLALGFPALQKKVIIISIVTVVHQTNPINN